MPLHLFRSPALGLAASLAIAHLTAAPAVAQSGSSGGQTERGAALIQLFEDARTGAGDRHLPFVLNRLKKALGEQNAIAVLELIDPVYFQTQFSALNSAGTSPGVALGRFLCELFNVCDISKSYRFNDIVSMLVISAEPMQQTFGSGFSSSGDGASQGATQFIEVRIEVRMWDGVTIETTLFYDPSNARLSGPIG